MHKEQGWYAPTLKNIARLINGKKVEENYTETQVTLRESAKGVESKRDAKKANESSASKQEAKKAPKKNMR